MIQECPFVPGPGEGMVRPAVVGWREWVGLPEIQRAPVLAKIDTGAWSNTLHAADIEIIESNTFSNISVGIFGPSLATVRINLSSE